MFKVWSIFLALGNCVLIKLHVKYVNVLILITLQPTRNLANHLRVVTLGSKALLAEIRKRPRTIASFQRPANFRKHVCNITPHTFSDHCSLQRLMGVILAKTWKASGI